MSEETDTKSDSGIGIVMPQDFHSDALLELDCGKSLRDLNIRYETYGTLNMDATNAILVEHALTGDAHLAGRHSENDRKPGWWDEMVGPGRPFDTEKYFIICSNVLGGCSGTTGPGSIDPDTGEPYRMNFPVITIQDMVRAQKLLIDYLGIKKLLAVVGGSMGGMLLRFIFLHRRSLSTGSGARQSWRTRPGTTAITGNSPRKGWQSRGCWGISHT